MDLRLPVAFRRLVGFVRSALNCEQTLGAVFGAICRAATVEAEQPLAPQQPHHCGDVNYERAEAECGHFLGQLINLQRQEYACRDHREVLTPAPHEPQTHGLHQFRSARTPPARSRSTSASRTIKKTPVQYA